MAGVVKVKVRKKSGFDADKYLYEAQVSYDRKKLDDIAQESLNDFIKASPTNIASSWSYEIVPLIHGAKIVFSNSVMENGQNVAIVMDLGHATVTGYWVPGQNYLREPINKTYKRIKEMMEAQ